MAEQWALNAQLVVTLMRGDFDRSRDLTHELVERCPFADGCVVVVAAAISEVLLGQPEFALATVTQPPPATRTATACSAKVFGGLVADDPELEHHWPGREVLFGDREDLEQHAVRRSRPRHLGGRRLLLRMDVHHQRWLHGNLPLVGPFEQSCGRVTRAAGR